MHLKAITLHGFKSFVNRTQLDFEPGMTAIVGPNGSGKSNLSDAFRWVLGEQSIRTLRGRRTEDVLFNGGPGRAPAGMAEVSLTFDNSNQWLDVPFAEVTISRRAYRSGENEYYINRDRVRLRDVTDILGRMRLGSDGFAIVGQGTVDAALSLRPEDRRGLIEQAAAIGHLYTRLDDAKARLQDTRNNLGRLDDLIAELQPQLEVLEKQAAQAREHESLQAEYQRHAILWYAHQWCRPLERRTTAVADAKAFRTQLEATREKIQLAQWALDGARQRRVQSEQTVNAEADRTQQATSALATLSQEAALIRERRANGQQRLADHDATLEQQHRARERDVQQLQAMEAQRITLLDRTASLEDEIRRSEKESAAWDSQRKSLQRDVQEARTTVNRLESRRAAAEAEQRAAAERLGQLQRSLSEHQQRLVERQAELPPARARVEETQQELRRARQEVDEVAANRRSLANKLDRAHAEAAEHSKALATVDREIQALRARHDALQSADETGAGYFSGVRAVLLAANGRGPVRLNGIHGIVAKLIEVPPNVELAIETALGGHLQDVVVATWEDAEAAIAHLKTSGSGRATFLPINTLRSSRRPAPPPSPGILGVATELVGVASQFQVINDYLLGQTLVVENLSIARRILHELSTSWQIVTLEGDITRATGVVTGGAPGPTRGTLSRFRELRAGRLAIADRERERKTLASRVADAQATLEDVQTRLSDLTRASRAAEERARGASNNLAEAQRVVERLTHNLTWQSDELRRLTEQEEKTRLHIAQLEGSQSRLQEESVGAAAALEQAESKLADFVRHIDATVAALPSLRAQCDAAREQLAALETGRKQAQSRLDQIDRDLAARKMILGEIQKALAELAEQDEYNQKRQKECEQAAATANERLQIAQAAKKQTAELEKECAASLHDWESRERTVVNQLQEAERRLDRAEAETESLRQQILLDLGMVDDSALDDGNLIVTLATGTRVQAPLNLSATPDKLRSQIETLRARLKSMVPNPNAITAHADAVARLEFLTGQAADLDNAATTLRSAIEETQTAMTSKFTETFAVVARTFSQRFIELFGGGTASLILDSENPMAGIEVIAQPPGKRSQNLAALSGGERALTAAALMCALIEANPPPFCVLDEVDAALDDSNVGRFCDLLRTLSERTQIIVITHNRRTMEAASAIFGLTLQNRSESRVLSMKLPGSSPE